MSFGSFSFLIFFLPIRTLSKPRREPVGRTPLDKLSRMYETSRTNISELPDELVGYLPTSKWDPDAIKRLSQLDPKKRNILLPQLLIWMQDINWPNAGKILPFLIAGGEEVIPEIEWVLNGQDDIWKGNCIRHILTELSSDTVRPLLPTLKRIAEAPTASEKVEEVDVDANTCIKLLYLS